MESSPLEGRRRRITKGSSRHALAGAGCLLAAACSTIGPNDVPKAEPATFRADVLSAWPGAPKVLATADCAGESAVRHGDRLLYGLELVNGDKVVHRLLTVTAVREGRPMFDTGSMTMTHTSENGDVRIEERPVRPLVVEFATFDAAGVELQRSRSDATADWIFEAGFIDGIGLAPNAGEDWARAAIRLVTIVNILQADPILSDLLREVATVPLDLRLLFRRNLELIPDFAAGKSVAWGSGDELGTRLGQAYELPFDLLLNGSVFVRLSATVIAPKGPTGAAGGIVALRAQEAKNTGRQIRLQMLACARGPQSDWQQHGMLVRCGFADEGVALAFAPDGSRVATPGANGLVELRDLRAADPSHATVLVGGKAPVADLAFLDADTVLVARGQAVEVFAIAGALSGQTLVPVAVFALERRPVALCASGAGHFFIGCGGGEVQRWSFESGTTLPVREVVRGPVASSAEIGASPARPVELDPGRDFLEVAGDGERVAVRWFAENAEYRRRDDGTWGRFEIPAPASTRPVLLSKCGDRVERSDGSHAYVGKSLQISWRTERGYHGVLFDGPPAGDSTVVAHGFDPTGRFYAYVAPGLRLLLDGERVRASLIADAAAR